MKNNLLKKFMEFGVGSFVTLLLGFITSPIITRIISPEQNGRFSMFNTVINLIMIITMLGLDQSYVRYYYDEEIENRPRLLKLCIREPIIIGIIVSIFVMIFYKKVSMYIVQEKSFMVVVLFSINLLLCIVSRFAMLEIRMKQKGKLYSLLNIITKITNLIFVIIFFLLYNDNYITLIWATTITNLFVTMIAIFSERDEWLKRSNSKTQLNVSKKEILTYGIPLIFSMSITWAFQSIDRISIKEFVGFYELGIYNGAMTIIALLNTVQSTFTTFWVPVAFERYSTDKNDKEFFENVNAVITVVMLLIAVLLIFSKEWIVLLLGQKYREAVFIFPYLVFMPIMYTISETTVLGINFLKKPKYHVYIAFISAISNMIGNLYLVPKYGATGAAISTGISYMIFFAMRTYFSVKLYKVNYNIGKFIISTLLLFIFATYSSFNRLDIYIVILALINIVSILFLYKDVLTNNLKEFNVKFKNNKKRAIN